MDSILGKIAAALQARDGPAAVRVVQELNTSRSNLMERIAQGSDVLSPAVFVDVMDGVLARSITSSGACGTTAAVDQAEDLLAEQEVRSCRGLRPTPERAAPAHTALQLGSLGGSTA
jgi:hypothetical protein